MHAAPLYLGDLDAYEVHEMPALAQMLVQIDKRAFGKKWQLLFLAAQRHQAQFPIAVFRAALQPMGGCGRGFLFVQIVELLAVFAIGVE